VITWLSWRNPLRSLAVGAALVLAVAGASGAPPADASGVHGDDERDRYVGTGGLILPGSIDQGTRAMVAGCPDCHWRMTTPCFDSSAGLPFGSQTPCLSTSRGCGLGNELLRSWFRAGESPWREIGLVCIADGPITVAGVGRDVREQFIRDLAPARPLRQPASGVVTQIPVIFDSGQRDGTVRTDYLVAGQRVSLSAQAAWRWDFGDGSRLSTVDPGGAFPHDGVAHAYRRAGEYRVRMTTQWAASFTVAGLGPFDVVEPVMQTADLTMPVGEGRAVLAVR
jgi:hypothetical protein